MAKRESRGRFMGNSAQKMGEARTQQRYILCLPDAQNEEEGEEYWERKGRSEAIDFCVEMGVTTGNVIVFTG